MEIIEFIILLIINFINIKLTKTQKFSKTKNLG